MKNRAGIFVLICTGILLGLLLTEILVRIFLPQNRLTTWIEMHPDGFMLNQQSITAIQNFDDRRVSYRLNRTGLRGNEIPDESDLNILFLGDSFTFGLLLNEEDTFLAHLQRYVESKYPAKNITILNAGVGGAGLADWPQWLETFGEQIAPDIVIHMLNRSDIDRSISKNLFVANPSDSSLVKSQRWKPRNYIMAIGRQGWYRWLQQRSDLMNVLVGIAWDKLYFKDITNGLDSETSQVPVPTEEQRYIDSGYSNLLGVLLLERMHDWCADNNCEFILATTGFFAFEGHQYYTHPFYEKAVEGGTGTVPFFDVTGCFVDKTGGDKNSILIPGDGHPNEEGAEMIAGCTWEWLEPVIDERAGRL